MEKFLGGKIMKDYQQTKSQRTSSDSGLVSNLSKPTRPFSSPSQVVSSVGELSGQTQVVQCGKSGKKGLTLARKREQDIKNYKTRVRGKDSVVKVPSGEEQMGRPARKPVLDVTNDPFDYPEEDAAAAAPEEEQEQEDE